MHLCASPSTSDIIMKQVHTESFFLSAGEVNAEGEMSLPLLAEKIIDIATAHANTLGIGNPAMASLNLGWVLSRLTIEMNSWPKANENYTLSTWIEDWNRHFSLRCFRIDGADGSPLGYARTVWMVMNTSTHENAGLGHLNIPEGIIPGLECPIARQAKHRVIVEPKEGVDFSAKALMATEPTSWHTFRYCDIDYYRHVNTVRYISLLLNQFPLSLYDSCRISRIELNFLHEAQYGERVKVLTAFTGKSGDDNIYGYSQSLTRPVDDREETLLYARLFFCPR